MRQCLPLGALFFCLAAALAQTSAHGAASGAPDEAPFSRTPFMQVDILRTAPDDDAPFVPMLMPKGWGPEPREEVLSCGSAGQGEWEEVRLTYRFKYNGSTDPNVCEMSLFEGAFTGWRRVPAGK